MSACVLGLPVLGMLTCALVSPWVPAGYVVALASTPAWLPVGASAEPAHISLPLLSALSCLSQSSELTPKDKSCVAETRAGSETSRKQAPSLQPQLSGFGTETAVAATFSRVTPH